MIFGINTTSDISKLLYEISWAVRRVKFETILKYHERYFCQITRQIMLLFVYTTTRKRFVIFTCRYFKLSWNTTALSQSNCRNFSCSSINDINSNEIPNHFVQIYSWFNEDCFGHWKLCTVKLLFSGHSSNHYSELSCPNAQSPIANDQSPKQPFLN